ncbi:unnamed protein product, partial [Prorocentrum cordatum]
SPRLLQLRGRAPGALPAARSRLSNMMCAPLFAKAPTNRETFRGGWTAPAVPGSERDEVAPVPEPRPLLFKTKLCSFFAAGACERGAECRFAHGPGELAERPDFSRTRLCPTPALVHRACAAPHCAFAHGPHELLPCLAKRATAPPGGAEPPAAPVPRRRPLRRGGRRAAPARRVAEQAAQQWRAEEAVRRALPLLQADKLRSGRGSSWAAYV